MYDHTFSKLTNHQIRHQATHKVGCQPGDCIWSLYCSSGVCVGMYGLAYMYSLYYPHGIADKTRVLLPDGSMSFSQSRFLTAKSLQNRLTCNSTCTSRPNLKGRIVQPPRTDLKCTSAAAPTLQQTVACGLRGFKSSEKIL